MTRTPPAPQMSLLFDLWLVRHLVDGALDEIVSSAAGVSGEDFGFYSLLRRFGPVTASQVSRWTGLPATTVSATVRRLSARGHVEQRPNPADGRSRLVGLTSAGVEAHADTADVFYSATRALAAALGNDQAGQRASLQRLDRALREVGGLDPRPYSVDEPAPGGVNGLAYGGPPLTPDEEDSVRAYIDFVRLRRPERTTQ